MNVRIPLGSTVTLRGASATKIWVGDHWVGHGYIGGKNTYDVVVKHTIGTILIDTLGGCHSLVPEHDDDFNLIVAIDGNPV